MKVIGDGAYSCWNPLDRTRLGVCGKERRERGVCVEKEQVTLRRLKVSSERGKRLLHEKQKFQGWSQ